MASRRPLAVVRTTVLHFKYGYDLPMRKAGVLQTHR